MLLDEGILMSIRNVARILSLPKDTGSQAEHFLSLLSFGCCDLWLPPSGLAPVVRRPFSLGGRASDSVMGGAAGEGEWLDCYGSCHKGKSCLAVHAPLGFVWGEGEQMGVCGGAGNALQ